MILTELTFAILKYSFLVLLWVFVWFAVRSLRRDIEIFSPKSLVLLRISIVVSQVIQVVKIIKII